MNMKQGMQGVMVFVTVVCMLGGALAQVPSPVASGDGIQFTTEGARALLAKLDPSLVSVKITARVTIAMEGRESGKEEQDNETSGCIVGSGGLVAVSLSSIDPKSMYEDIIGSGPEADKFKIQSEITDIKLHFSDGKEVPGEVVLRDKDLDIAFIKPKTPLGYTVAVLDLANAADARILDQVLVVSRLGKSANWASRARMERVNTVLTKPRKMYMLTSEDVGAVVAAPDGKIIGIQMLRKVVGAGKDQPEVLTVVLPAKDILADARQVEK